MAFFDKLTEVAKNVTLGLCRRLCGSFFRLAFRFFCFPLRLYLLDLCLEVFNPFLRDNNFVILPH